MTALDLPYAADGLAEIEKAIEAGEMKLALQLAEFLDQQTGGVIGRVRIGQALEMERAA